MSSAKYTQLFGSLIKTREAAALSPSLTVGAIWQKTLQSPHISFDLDKTYDAVNNPVQDTNYSPPLDIEFIGNSITASKIQYGFSWNELMDSRFVVNFFTGMGSYLPDWDLVNNQSGDYYPGSTVTVPVSYLNDTWQHAYMCKFNPALGIKGASKTTGDIPGFKTSAFWQCCTTNLPYYAQGSWYEELTTNPQDETTIDTGPVTGLPTDIDSGVAITRVSNHGSTKKVEININSLTDIKAGRSVVLKSDTNAFVDPSDSSILVDSVAFMVKDVLSDGFTIKKYNGDNVTDADGSFNLANTLDIKRYGRGEKFRIKVGSFPLWEDRRNKTFGGENPDSNNDFDWGSDCLYMIVKVVNTVEYLDPEAVVDHRNFPFFAQESFGKGYLSYQAADNSSYGAARKSLKVNSEYDPDKNRIIHLPLDVDAWEHITNYSADTIPASFFASMIAPINSIISGHFRTEYVIFSTIQNPEVAFSYTERYLRPDNIVTTLEPTDEFSYELLPESSFDNLQIFARDSRGQIIDPPVELSPMGPALTQDEYNYFAYYLGSDGQPDFNAPKFLQGQGFVGDDGSNYPTNITQNVASDFDAAAGEIFVADRDRFEVRLQDYIRVPDFPGMVFSSRTASLRTLVGKLPPELIFTEAEYRDIYNTAPPVGLVPGYMQWPAYNKFGLNAITKEQMALEKPELAIPNTLVAEFAARARSAASFDWLASSAINLYTWDDKAARTVTKHNASELIDFHRINTDDIISTLTPRISGGSPIATESIANSLSSSSLNHGERIPLWHKGVKIPIYCRLLYYPYLKNKPSYPGNGGWLSQEAYDAAPSQYRSLGSTSDSGVSFDVYISALGSFVPVYNQVTGFPENINSLNSYETWHPPGPNQPQETAGYLDISKSSFDHVDSAGSGRCTIYNSSGTANENATLKASYEKVWDSNSGAIIRFPESVSNAINFSDKDSNFHRIGYVQFPRTNTVTNAVIKDITLLGSKIGSEADLVKLPLDANYSWATGIENDPSQEPLGTGTVTGGYNFIIDKIGKAVPREDDPQDAQEEHNRLHTFEYKLFNNGEILFPYTLTGANGNVRNNDPTSEQFGRWTLDASTYIALPSTLTAEEYHDLPGVPSPEDVDSSGGFLGEIINQSWYFEDVPTGGRYARPFNPDNSIRDDDIQQLNFACESLASNISSVNTQYFSATTAEAYQIKLVDQPFFFAQEKSSTNLYGNFRKPEDTETTLGKFYFYTGHANTNFEYPEFKFAIPALLESTTDLPVDPQFHLTINNREAFWDISRTDKSFIRSIRFKQKSSGFPAHDNNGLYTINALNNTPIHIALRDNIEDGAGYKVTSGEMVLKNVPGFNNNGINNAFTIPSTGAACLVFYQGDTSSTTINTSYPMVDSSSGNNSSTGNRSGELQLYQSAPTTHGLIKTWNITSALQQFAGFNQTELPAGTTAVSFRFDDGIGLDLPQESAGSIYSTSGRYRMSSNYVIKNITRSSIDPTQMENYKGGLLWVYKDQDFNYSGLNISNPAITDSDFGSTWLGASYASAASGIIFSGALSSGAFNTNTGQGFISITKNSFNDNYQNTNFSFYDGIGATHTNFGTVSTSAPSLKINTPEITGLFYDLESGYVLFAGSAINISNGIPLTVEYKSEALNYPASNSSDIWFKQNGTLKINVTTELGNFDINLDKSTINSFGVGSSSINFNESLGMGGRISTASATINDNLINRSEVNIINDNFLSRSGVGDLSNINFGLKSFRTEPIFAQNFMPVDYVTSVSLYGNIFSPYQRTNASVMSRNGSAHLNPGTALLPVSPTSLSRYACASEGLVGRQEVYFAELKAIHVIGLRSRAAHTWSLQPFGSTAAHYGGEGSVTNFQNINGAQEYNLWATDLDQASTLTNAMKTGYYTSKIGGAAICLASDAAHIQISANNGYILTDQSTNGQSLPMYFSDGSGGRFSDKNKTVSAPGLKNGVNMTSGGTVIPAGKAMVPDYGRDGDKIRYTAMNKMNGWRMLSHHRLVQGAYLSNRCGDWSDGTLYPEGVIVFIPIDGVKYLFTCVETHTSATENKPTSYYNFGPWAPHQQDNLLQTWFNSRSAFAAGTGVVAISQPENTSDNRWGNLDSRIFNKGSNLNNSYTGRNPAAYHGFQNGSSATRISKIVAGLFPGVTYRLYFTAAYRPNYSDQGCRVYVSEQHTNTYDANETRDYSDPVELIAYGEFTPNNARAINYNGINADLDNRGQIINWTRENPHVGLDTIGANAAVAGPVDDTLRNDRFKIFWVEFTPKSGGSTVEIMFETAFMASSISKPDTWKEIPGDDFFDYDKYNIFRYEWLNRFQGPWEVGGPDGTWFLDEVWITSTRPTWREKTEINYRMNQGGYHLSIDQGDKNNVNCKGGVRLKNNFKEQLRKIYPLEAFSNNWADQNSNGFFKAETNYRMDIIRQHSHIHNWDPICADARGYATQLMYSRSTWVDDVFSPCNYYKGVVYSPPNPGLYRLKDTSNVNSNARICVNGKDDAAEVYHAYMPTTNTSYNTYWENIDDRDYEYFIDNNILEPILRKPIHASGTNDRLTYSSTFSPQNIDSRFDKFHNVSSYPHKYVPAGVWVILPIFGFTFFYNQAGAALLSNANTYAVVDSGGNLYPGFAFVEGSSSTPSFLGGSGWIFFNTRDSAGVFQNQTNLAPDSKTITLPENGDIFFTPSTAWSSIYSQIGNVIIYTNPCIWPWAKVISGNDQRWVMFDVNLGDSIVWDDAKALNLHQDWYIGAPQNISPISTGEAFNKDLIYGHDKYTMGESYFDGERLSKNYLGDYLVFNVKNITNLFLSRPSFEGSSYISATGSLYIKRNSTGVDTQDARDNGLYEFL